MSIHPRRLDLTLSHFLTNLFAHMLSLSHTLSHYVPTACHQLLPLPLSPLTNRFTLAPITTANHSFTHLSSPYPPSPPLFLSPIHLGLLWHLPPRPLPASHNLSLLPITNLAFHQHTFTLPPIHQQVYSGTYHHGQRHGRGVLTLADGRVYDGGWVDDKKQGHGVCKWADGR